jgi:hypothetical protein
MRLVTFDLGSRPIDAAGETSARIEDLRLAAALLVGAASAAEAEIASSGFAGRAATPQTHAWSPEALAAARPLGKIIKACNELEAALAVPAHLLSPATLKSIAAVEAARAAMPDERTQVTIALVSKTIAAVSPCVEAAERGASVGSRSLITAIDRRLD